MLHFHTFSGFTSLSESGIQLQVEAMNHSRTQNAESNPDYYATLVQGES